MALTLSLVQSDYSADCGTQSFIDETVYGNGEAERNTLAVIVTGIKKNLPDEEDQPLNVSGNDGDPLTDSTWYTYSQVDGWHILTMYAIPLYNPLEGYSTGEVTYDSGAIWLCIEPVTGTGPPDPTYWEQILIDDPSIQQAQNVQYDNFNYIFTCRVENCFATVTAKATSEGCCEGCTDTELKQTYERLEVLLNGIYVNCRRLMYSEAEKNVRNMTNICEKSKCICS